MDVLFTLGLLWSDNLYQTYVKELCMRHECGR